MFECVCVLPEQRLLPLSFLSLTEIQIKQYLKSVCKKISFLESVTILQTDLQLQPAGQMNRPNTHKKHNEPL